MSDNHNNDEFVTQEQLKTSRQDITSPQNFANHFLQALSHSKPMNNALSKIVRELIKKDDDVKQEVANTVNKIDRDKWKLIRNKTFTSIIAIMLFVSGAIVTKLIDKFFS